MNGSVKATGYHCFNTANGKHCCNQNKFITNYKNVLLVSIPQAVGTVTSSPLFSLPFGQGLEMCGPHRRFAPLLPRTLRRIPQAVGTVATRKRSVLLHYSNNGSIPQAVGTVATWYKTHLSQFRRCSFNTASGKYCYFITFVFPSLWSGTRDVRASSSLCFSTASHPSSHTASGKHCCNYREGNSAGHFE